MDNYPRYSEVPKCENTQIAQIRIFRRLLPGGTEDILEVLYRDGNGNYFWAPVPIVIENSEKEQL
jgi:hypothetical protein